MGVALEVSTQGISTDWNQANGSYDPVERGPIDSEELERILGTVLGLQEPDYSSGDLCGPAVHINGPGGEVSVFLDDGTLRGGDDSVEMTPHEVVALATGQEPGVVEQVAARSAANAAAEAEARAEAARAQAVRRPEVPPTPQDLNPASIDTSSSAPQVSLQVWKSGNWLALAYTPWALAGFFAFVGIIVIGSDPGPGLVSLLVAVGLFFAQKPLKTVCRVDLRMGLDWATNTLWVVRGGQLEAWESNANSIKDVLYDVDDTDVEYVYTGEGIGGGTERTYPLYVLRSGDRIDSLGSVTLYSKKDANGIVDQARQLLGVTPGSGARVAPGSAASYEGVGKFKGRIGRLKYLGMMIGAIIAGVILVSIVEGTSSSSSGGAPLVAMLFILLLQSIPIVRRFHDLDKSGLNFWLMLVPLYNIYLAILLLFKRGTEGSNRFGPDPLDPMGTAAAAPPVAPEVTPPTTPVAPPPAPQPTAAAPPQQAAAAPPPPPAEASPAQAAAPPAPTPPAAPAAQQSQSSGDADAMAQLEKLADLKEKGVISAEEFEEKKKELLGRI